MQAHAVPLNEGLVSEARLEPPLPEQLERARASAEQDEGLVLFPSIPEPVRAALQQHRHAGPERVDRWIAQAYGLHLVLDGLEPGQPVQRAVRVRMVSGGNREDVVLGPLDTVQGTHGFVLPRSRPHGSRRADFDARALVGGAMDVVLQVEVGEVLGGKERWLDVQALTVRDGSSHSGAGGAAGAGAAAGRRMSGAVYAAASADDGGGADSALLKSDAASTGSRDALVPGDEDADWGLQAAPTRASGGFTAVQQDAVTLDTVDLRAGSAPELPIVLDLVDRTQACTDFRDLVLVHVRDGAGVGQAVQAARARLRDADRPAVLVVASSVDQQAAQRLVDAELAQLNLAHLRTPALVVGRNTTVHGAVSMLCGYLGRRHGVEAAAAVAPPKVPPRMPTRRTLCFAGAVCAIACVCIVIAGAIAATGSGGGGHGLRPTAAASDVECQAVRLSVANAPVLAFGRTVAGVQLHVLPDTAAVAAGKVSLALHGGAATAYTDSLFCRPDRQSACVVPSIRVAEPGNYTLRVSATTAGASACVTATEVQVTVEDCEPNEARTGCVDLCAAGKVGALACRNGGACNGAASRGHDVVCDCTPGWTGLVCSVDVDECQVGNGGCSDDCYNTPGSFHCACPSPATLQDDQRTCDWCPADEHKTVPGACGCGVSEHDTDGDGTPDCHDECPVDQAKTAAGVCGCGVADADSDGDGVLDCEDVCPHDPRKSRDAGACGCGASELDANHDGVVECDPCDASCGSCVGGTSDDCLACAQGYTATDARVVCPAGYTLTASGKCYRLTDAMPWSDAVAACGADDVGFLTVPASAEENDAMVALAQAEPIAVSTVWLGLSDMDQENHFVSAHDGSLVSIGSTAQSGAYTHWNTPAEPNNEQNQDCVQLYTEAGHSNTGKWDDYWCSSSRMAVCEAPAVVVRSCGRDRDGDGVANGQDGCPDDSHKTEPGACGCGVSDQDTSGNGLPDCSTCDASCGTCVGDTSQDCLACASGYTSIGTQLKCPTGYTLATPDSCYRLTDAKAWPDAVADCAADHNGYLALPTNPEENDAMLNLALAEPVIVPGVWLGLSDIDRENRFVAVRDGYLVSIGSTAQAGAYVNWNAPAEPNNEDNQDCVQLYTAAGHSNTGLWDDYWCDSARMGVCRVAPVEVQSCGRDQDGDGVADDQDGCPHDASKTEPGACGCGVSAHDNDSDGLPECDACDASCGTCVGDTSEECLVCAPGYAPARMRPECPTGYTLAASGKCYRLTDAMSWSDAVAACGADDVGFLTVPASAEENDAMVALAQAEPTIVPSVWLGLSDMDQENHFVSVHDGSLVSIGSTAQAGAYTHWNAPREPNNEQNQDCVQLYTEAGHSNTGKWDDYWCSTLRMAVCEAPAVMVVSCDRDHDGDGVADGSPPGRLI